MEFQRNNFDPHGWRLALRPAVLSPGVSRVRVLAQRYFTRRVVGAVGQMTPPMRTKGLILGVIAALACLAVPGVAWAHPHVWVKVRSQIGFTAEGKVNWITQDWTFDEEYSAFAVQGLTKEGHLADREDFKPMATENGAALTTIGFYTTLKIGGKAATFINPTDYWMEEGADKLVKFHVSMLLKAPMAPGPFFTLQVSDPEFFIDFEFDDANAITFVDAPTGCSQSMAKPKPLAPDEKAKLTESFFSGLPIGANFGLKMASRAIIACP